MDYSIGIKEASLARTPDAEVAVSAPTGNNDYSTSPISQLPIDSTPGEARPSRPLIAICGMAVRLPGGVQDPEAFWDVLVNQIDLRGPIPSNRYNAEAYTDKMGKRGAIKAQYGYFLSEDLGALDTSFFSTSKLELERSDPQQRQVLEVTRDVLESAGETDYRGKPIGCYVGTFGDDWLQMSAKEQQHIGVYTMTGHADFMLANRLSFEYDLKGPSMVIKTACSASLTGVHEACRAIYNGDCSSAIVAGTNLIMDPARSTAMTEEGILSPEGSCKTFDADANGYARGEAINAIYMKLLDEAIRDKNPIRAIIRNTGANSDGKSQGLSTPNSSAQEALMRKVYADINLDPGKTAYVECHGTGTQTGDPLETNAVGNVFGKHGVYIGSVKPNVGHSEGASGLTSLIKGVLALEKNTIPPNIKFSKPNPKILFESKKLKVAVQPQAWPAGRDKRISINSFGIAGSNAHVILEAAPSALNNGSTQHETSTSPNLVVASANTNESLKKYLEDVKHYVEQNRDNTTDLAYNLAHRREHLPYRAFIVANPDGSLGETSTATKVPSSKPGIILVFSGQGAQWPGMGKRLFELDEGFRKDMADMNAILKSVAHPPDWNLQDELFASAEQSQIDKAELAQPLSIALQLALVRRLYRAGIRPAAVVGHSSGEVAAAYAAGGLSLEEAMITAYYRGYVAKHPTRPGGMGAVGLGVDEVTPYLKDGVVIACDNSPSSVTLSGAADALDEALSAIKADNEGTVAKRLKVDMAYHSHHIKPLAARSLELIQSELERRCVKRPVSTHIPLFSSVTGDIITSGASLGPAYWMANATSRVRFTNAVRRILDERSGSLFLEIGSHSTLSGPLRQIFAEAGAEYRYVSTLVRGGDSFHDILRCFGQLYQSGVSLDWPDVVPLGRVLTNAPRYSWDHSSGSFWYESRLSKESRLRKFGHHRLLGVRIPESSSFEPAWRNILTLVDEPWLADHKIRTDTVFPFGCYIAMAGEAIRQVTGIGEGYRIRHAMARLALVLSDAPVEIVTTLRTLKLTDSADSSWFEFCIASNSGSSWTKHCEGQIKACTESLEPSLKPSTDCLPREVPSQRWYTALARVGLVYGPEFQGLQDIFSSTTENLAVANIENDTGHHDPAFLFHPASIDSCFQLLFVSMAKGIGRKFDQLRLPTVMEDIFVRRSSPIMGAVAVGRNFDDLSVEVTTGEKVALRLSGVQFTTVNDSGQSGRVEQHESFPDEPHAAARLEWLPDFDMVDHSTLFTPPRSIPEETRIHEEMTLLCILETADRLRGLKACNWHFGKFRDWLNLEIERAKEGTYPILHEDSKPYVNLAPVARHLMIEERYNKLLQTPSKSSLAIGIKRIYDNCEALFTGESDTLDTLMRDGVLTEIYNTMSFGKGNFFKLLSHSRPDLRVLEVGAGTGGTTEMILRSLVRPTGLPAYSVYTFTDISAGFFQKARERFSYAPNMDYRVFDISQNPLDQGFQANTYDVVLAPNVVHATASLHDTLANLHSLLRPGGLLVLTELCGAVRTFNYIFGNFSGWWLGEADGRPNEPYVPLDRWDSELKAVGFSGVDTAVRDAEEPFLYSAAIVSTKVKEVVNQTIAHDAAKVSVVTDYPEGILSKSLVTRFSQSGISTHVFRLGDANLPADVDIVCLVDLEVFFFENITEERLNAFQEILKRHKSGRILWLTKPAQVNCEDPRSAQTLGVARSIRAESMIPFYTLEIRATEPQFVELVHQVMTKIQCTEDVDLLAPDKEYVVDEGLVKIGRYQPFLVRKELRETSPAIKDQGNTTKTLHITKTGSLEQFTWVSDLLPQPEDGEVTIDTRAVGLIFKDILYALGILRPDNGQRDLFGFEMAGVVSKVGHAVQNLAVGDRVLAMPPTACFKTKFTCPASLVKKIPRGLSFEDAATMPICYTTVIEALINIGQLGKGQSVLIHSAAGGVGHAAIQICQRVGAEIFATVGNEEKVDYLVKTFDIPEHHIFHSRDESFASALKRETGGRGVDVVLNSVSGELLHASWDCVAEFGKLIELGKRDIIDGGNLGMKNFLKSRSYCCVDVTHLAQKKPHRAGAILQKCLDLYEAGDIQPLSPSAIFEADAAQAAFRHMQDAKRIGKVVVRLPEDTEQMEAEELATVLSLKRNASYLLTGGMGGLGTAISTWLVERGAKSLVFLSRSAGQKPEDQAFIRELEASGCSVITVAGHAESAQDIQLAISLAPQPIKGVIHLAMVLRDSPVAAMSHIDWVAANAPKVQGAWNLHNSFHNHELDFLVLASSVVTIIEQPGQGNYSAANTFLEAFTQYRHSLSLPASVLNIAPIDGIGFVAENPFARKNMKAQGVYFLREPELLDFLELAIRLSPATATSTSHLTPITISPIDSNNDVGHSGQLQHHRPWASTAQLVMGLRSDGNLNDTNTKTNWRRDRRMGFYHNANDATSTKKKGSSDDLARFLAGVVDNPQILDEAGGVMFLAKEIGKKIFSMMLKEEEDLDTDLTVQQIGLDSLMAISLRRWWRHVFGLEISVLEIMAAGTLKALGAMAAKTLKQRG